jgi:VanZ family protein
MDRHPARSPWALPTGVAAAILLASVVPLPGDGMEPAPGPFGVDAWLHVVGYAALAASLSRAVSTAGHGTVVAIAVAVAAAVGFGVGIELLQTVVPTRGFAWSDVAADAVGSAIGGTGWWRSRRRFTDRGGSEHR